MYTFTIFLLIFLLSVWTLTVEAKGPKKPLRCHVCSTKDDLECNFIHDRFTKFLSECNNIVDEDNKEHAASCMVQRFTKDESPVTERLCGPTDCPSSAKCCNCSKPGCNGNNVCLLSFSNAYSSNPSQLLACLGLLIFVGYDIFMVIFQIVK